MADLNKFNQLLESNDYSILEYFSYHQNCVLVKVVHGLTGRIFFISVAKRYRLAIQHDLVNHFHLSRENDQAKHYTSQQLSESYPMIQLLNQGEGVIDDISDKLHTNYKQPIQLQSTSIQEQMAQLKRLKYCFRMLEYKILLHTDQHILLLDENNAVQTFKVENYPKTQMHSFYIVVTLEQLYAKLNVIHDLVAQVEVEFYGILDMNQMKHNEYLTTSHIEFFIHNNDKLLHTKQQLHFTNQEICKLLQMVQQKEQTCRQKLREIRKATTTSSNIYRDAERAKQKEEWESKYEQVHSTKLQLLDKLVKLNVKIKNMYLILDQLGFNLSLSFNELRSELYKMLL